MEQASIAACRTDNDARHDAPICTDRARVLQRSALVNAVFSVLLYPPWCSLIESLINGSDHRKDVQLSNPGSEIRCSRGNSPVVMKS